MAQPYPFEAYWRSQPPGLIELAKLVCNELAFRDRVIWTWNTGDSKESFFAPATFADEAPTQFERFGLRLPGDADLFYRGTSARTFSFGRTGPDLSLPFDDPEEEATLAMLEAFAVAIVAGAGADFAWNGTYREDHMSEWVEAFEEAMEARGPGEPYPLEHLTRPEIATVCVWRPDVLVDIEATEEKNGLRFWRPD